MKNYKPVTAPNMLGCLKKHHNYETAEELIRERVPECLEYNVSFIIHVYAYKL